MASLSNAAAPPCRGEVTRCERQCTWVTCSEEDAAASDEYGPLDIQVEVGESPLFEHSSDALFLPTEDVNIAKKSFNAWYNSGVLAALDTLAEHKVDGQVSWPSKMSVLLLGAARSFSALHSSFYPHLLMSGEELLAQFSGASHWATCPVRAMEWHPHASRLAVARKDNLVQVYQMQTTATSSCPHFSTGRMQQLKHPEQKRISSLAWKPYSGSVLAVGCQTGVVVWQVRSHPGAPRPHPQHLCSNGHSPVTSVAWSSDGRLLASASPADTSLMIWDVTSPDCTGTPITRHGGGGVSLLAWSSAISDTGMSRLLTATPSPLFRVWETRCFTCERWSNLAGRVTAACWSPDGNVLVFAMADDPALYYLTFFVSKTESADESTRRVGGADTAVKCVDLTPVEMAAANDMDEPVTVGGCVQSLAWDASGERLAATFTADSPGRDLVAIFTTTSQPVMEVLPCGFVRGRTGETPEVVAFQNDVESGALLSVAWSSGRIAFVPLLYNTPHSLDSASTVETLEKAQHSVSSIGTAFNSPVAPPLTARQEALHKHGFGAAWPEQSPVPRTPW
eukprot:scpid66854/ scgid27181/ Aladin; Adracalin